MGAREAALIVEEALGPEGTDRPNSGVMSSEKLEPRKAAAARVPGRGGFAMPREFGRIGVVIRLSTIEHFMQRASSFSHCEHLSPHAGHSIMRASSFVNGGTASRLCILSAPAAAVPDCSCEARERRVREPSPLATRSGPPWEWVPV
eukprot:CAMPEP_0115081440 /NCGR_PEP_ID=MMETSP0227-20121206/19272_1 /TAXON_ID=89957 /ORGANISM="Polarella glacialis, Strain CCMP 1383" /LENGTH=146 /DNA_ID=CAMNT_0002469269 /DNA_START=407 /DNA_END=848 /DNA_ORIENTATION=-